MGLDHYTTRPKGVDDPKCPSCGKRCREAWNFCPGCGTPLGASFIEMFDI